MTISDLLKYAVELELRVKTLSNKVSQLDNTRVTTRVVSNSVDSRVVEQSEFTLDIRQVMGEFDKAAKELRLVRQAIEKANHTIEIDFSPIY